MSAASAIPPLETTLRWWHEGERTLAATVDELTDPDLSQPSLLPDWSRGTVVAHLARNADALVNLLTWARTGVESPMYTSLQVRAADIAATVALAPAALRADLVEARAQLHEAVQAMPAEAWTAEVRTAQGRTVPASEVIWMRDREVWVHATDLGTSAAIWPEDFARTLIGDVLAAFARRDQTPAVTLIAGDHRWGSGLTRVASSAQELAAWLTGRGASPVRDAPSLPRWL